MENGKEVLAKVVQLRTQLVSQGHTRHLLAETDLMTCESTAIPPVLVKTRCTLTQRRIASSWF